jgi:hypothetical protein
MESKNVLSPRHKNHVQHLPAASLLDTLKRLLSGPDSFLDSSPLVAISAPMIQP